MRIGVLGAGQLGRMIALAGVPLGFRFRFLDPTPDSPGGHVAEQIVADYSDREALARFAEECDVVTYEFENVPVEAAEFLAERVPTYPPARALQQAQDRLYEKRLFLSLGVPTPVFDSIGSKVELNAALARIGFPAVLKTRRFGYDGKGQFLLKNSEDAHAAWSALEGQALILEGFIAFEREVSLVAARSVQGEVAFYPLVENHHRDGILRKTIAPAPGVAPELQAEAEDHLHRLMDALEYVGVLSVEFFEREGRLIANEMAPRVHNSGHWTIEGAETSQFENHLRAILGLPLGSTAPRGHAVMLNLIGATPDPEQVLATPNAHLHRYGKAPRPGRKVGHITLRAETPDACLQAAAALEPLV